MKILRIVYDWPPPWSGLAPHPYEITVAQTKLKHEINVFCGRWPFAGRIEQPPNVKIKGFLREPFEGAIFFTTSIAVFFYYLFWRKRNKPDLIHTHGHFAIWIFLYRAFLLRFKKNSEELTIPIIAHFHNTVMGRKNALDEKGLDVKAVSKYISWPLAKISDKLAVKVSNALIFVSEETKKEAIKYYMADEKKCYVVETGVNTKIFKPISIDEKDKTKKDIGLEPRDVVILNHGVMLERKNIHILVDAISFLPPKYKLLLAGPFPENAKEYKNRVDDLIFEKGLKHRVLMTGYVPYPNTPIAYQASDLFVLPSAWEGLPKVVMQSLACGVPALVSGFRLEEEIEGLNYLKGLTSRQLADQIVATIQKHSWVDVEKVKNLYSWDNRAAAIEKIYEQVIRPNN